MKTCTKCKTEQPEANFYKNGSGKLHPWCGGCQRQLQKDLRAKNPEKVRRQKKAERNRNRARYDDYRLRASYGISTAERSTLLEFQEGVCAICGRADVRKGGLNLHVDHCHQTGLVRGLLCHYCNTAIGALGDNPKTLRAAARYLELPPSICLAAAEINA